MTAWWNLAGPHQGNIIICFFYLNQIRLIETNKWSSISTQNLPDLLTHFVITLSVSKHPKLAVKLDFRKRENSSFGEFMTDSESRRKSLIIYAIKTKKENVIFSLKTDLFLVWHYRRLKNNNTGMIYYRLTVFTPQKLVCTLLRSTTSKKKFLKILLGRKKLNVFQWLVAFKFS